MVLNWPTPRLPWLNSSLNITLRSLSNTKAMYVPHHATWTCTCLLSKHVKLHSVAQNGSLLPHNLSNAGMHLQPMRRSEKSPHGRSGSHGQEMGVYQIWDVIQGVSGLMKAGMSIWGMQTSSHVPYVYTRSWQTYLVHPLNIYSPSTHKPFRWIPRCSHVPRTTTWSL